MVTIKDSIPSKSDSFLMGIDIFYTQFNDVNFYIEDEDQENFYHEIFRKLFPQIKLGKIFPLRGKNNVINKSSKHIGDKKKVFLVDKDFDDLLNKKITQSNLFYLDKYSIENYVIDNKSFKQYVIDERPRMKLSVVSKAFNFLEILRSACEMFYELTILHLLVQEKGLNIPNTSLAPEKFCSFGSSITIRDSEITNYKAEIQLQLNSIDKRLRVDSQLRRLERRFSFKSTIDLLPHIPGKYLVKYFKCIIEHLFSLASRNIDSFIYRLARTNDFANLTYLKDAVTTYSKSMSGKK